MPSESASKSMHGSWAEALPGPPTCGPSTHTLASLPKAVWELFVLEPLSWLSNPGPLFQGQCSRRDEAVHAALTGFIHLFTAMRHCESRKICRPHNLDQPTKTLDSVLKIPAALTTETCHDGQCDPRSNSGFKIQWPKSPICICVSNDCRAHLHK
jgi:hypothetical protein